MKNSDLKMGENYLITAKPDHTDLSNTRKFDGQIVTVTALSRSMGMENCLDTCWVKLKTGEKMVVFTDSLSLVEYVLPKKWRLKVDTYEECEIVAKWCNENKLSKESGGYRYFPKTRGIYSEQPLDNAPNFLRVSGLYTKVEDLSFTQITFDQFKEHVLNKKVIKASNFEVISTKVNGHIKSVANKEGNIFEIGDPVKNGRKFSLGNIISFSYSNDKTAVIAKTSIRNTRGVNIDLIDHDIILTNKKDYIKESIERLDKRVETNLEKAQRLFVKGVKFNNGNILRFISSAPIIIPTNFEITSSAYFENGGLAVRLSNGCRYSIFDGKTWAEIIK